MTNETGVNQSGMRRNVSARTQQREQHRRRTVFHMRHGDIRDDTGRARAARNVLAHDLAVLPQVKSAPVRVVLQAVLFLAGTSGIALDIRLKCRCIRQDLEQLTTNVGGSGLDVAEPGKIIAIVELDLRKTWEEISVGLLKVDLLLAKEDVQRLPEPGAGTPVDQASLEKLVTQYGLEVAGIALVYRLRTRKVFAQVRWQLIHWRSRLDGEAVER